MLTVSQLLRDGGRLTVVYKRPTYRGTFSLNGIRAEAEAPSIRRLMVELARKWDKLAQRRHVSP